MIKLNNKRKGFSLITTVFVILFVSSIGAGILSLSGKMVNETIVQYKKEQSILYAKSYTEMAILAATANDCILHIDGAEGGGSNTYDINVDISYVGNDVSGVAGCGAASVIGGNVNNVQSRGNSIIVDTEVNYPDNTSAVPRNIRYYRRTIQKL